MMAPAGLAIIIGAGMYPLEITGLDFPTHEICMLCS